MPTYIIPGNCCGCGSGIVCPTCPDLKLATTLFATLSGCPCLNGSYPITYNSEDGAWEGFSIGPHCGGSGAALAIEFACGTNGFDAGVGCAEGGVELFPLTGTCSPFVQTGTIPTSGCPDCANITITITE